jgi:undecaprenyl-diphosphatase
LNLLQALFLGALQGATEFLPVSSSGHLVLVPWLLNWNPPGLPFDAVVHLGTALAVVVYFWRDWTDIVRALLLSLRQRSLTDPNARLAWLIVMGTIPAALIGFLLADLIEELFARPVAAAGFLLVTAALLVAGERLGHREKELCDVAWPDALLIGLFQALAILPGISRSGATIAAGLGRGLRREPAARFSFLLATPIVLGTGAFSLLDLARAGDLSAQIPALAAGFLAAGIVGYGCITFLLRYLQRRRLYPFAVYCAAAGSACLIAALLRTG